MASLTDQSRAMETFSMNVIAQTLSAHTEMIAPGVMGINFMKPEKPINTMSEVYKLVQEQEQNKVKSPTPPAGAMSPTFMPTKIPPMVRPKPAPVQFTPPPPPAPAPKPQALKPLIPSAAPTEAQSQQGPCTDCGRFITGQFVCLNDRTLHEDCFKCSTCGTTLKNVGYHNINNKLYCDTHARLAANLLGSAGMGSAQPSYPGPAPTPMPVQAPFVPPMPVQAAPIVPPIPAPQPAPIAPTGITPFTQMNLPQTPSSSGGLAFRSISPQPFKRISGDYHRVTAPTSPTHSSTPSAPLAYSSGPLPFEMTPYMPPDQTRLSLFSTSSEASQTTETSQTTQISQTVQRTTQVSHQVSQQQIIQQQQASQQASQQTFHSSQPNFNVSAIDYKQVVGQSKTKFVWPPQKFEGEGGAPAASATPTPPQHYSPLATQATPANVTQPQRSEAPPTFRSVQPPVATQPQYAPPSLPPLEAPQVPAPPSMFTVPPLPTTIFPLQQERPQELEPALTAIPAPPEPAPLPRSEAPPAMSSGAQPQNFAPVLPPIVELKPQVIPAAQPGVPSGAGSKPAPKKGRGQLMSVDQTSPTRIPICADCGDPIRGPFIIALSRTWCPNHFHCNNLHCKAPLIDVGFVEEQGQLYCENCYEAFLAPVCNKCNVRIKGDCLNALDKQWHPECFICAFCHKPFGNNSFNLEDGLPYCEKDWNELFTTKCVGCGFPIEAGDRWVEALNNNYHSQCFKCSICNKNLEGQSFYAKGGKPFCKAHAR